MVLTKLQRAPRFLYWCGVVLCLMHFSFAFHPLPLMAQAEIALLDQLGEPDVDDEATDEDDDEDFIEGEPYAPRSGEVAAAVRKSHPNGFMLGVGRTEAWETTALSVRHWNNVNNMVLFGGGTGNYKTELQLSDFTYDIKMQTRGIYGGWRHFIGNSLPLFLQCGGGVTEWSGAVASRGGETSTAIDIDELSENYRASGAHIEGAVGFAGYWANGFSVEYVLMGIGKTLFTKYSSELENGADRAVRRNIEFPVWYGLLNIALGYYF